MEEFKNFYIYIVCVDIGFYMEPDIIIKKVFLRYTDAKKYSEKLENSFIKRRMLYL